jgi:hypothetical protein
LRFDYEGDDEDKDDDEDELRGLDPSGSMRVH